MSLKGLLIICLLASAEISFADSNLTGSWLYSSRACLSGKLPNPNVPQPEGTVSFTESTIYFTAPSSSGCTIEIGPEAVTIQGGRVTPSDVNATLTQKCPDGSVTKQSVENADFSYVVSGDKLNVTTNPSKWEDATCEKGDSHVITFVRTN